MSLETQTHSNLLFNVSTNQYADIAAKAKKRAAKANGANVDGLRTTTVLQKDNLLSTIFGIGADTIEIEGTDDLDQIDQSEWKGATAVTTFTTKKGKAVGSVASGADDSRKATVQIAKDTKPVLSFNPAREFETVSLYSMLNALSTASNSTPGASAIPAVDRALPSVFTSEKPVGIFGTPANDTPSFASFVEAVATKLDSADTGFDDGEFLADMKVAMPGFFQLLAANDDDGPSFAARGMAGYAQEAVTFAHEGLGVRRDVIDMRQGEAQERFMSVMKRIASYEANSGHHEASSFGLDLDAAA